jgi:xylulokinase
MTLLLEIAWSEAGTTTSVVDTVAHTTVGEGHAAHPAPAAGDADPDAWWAATVEATRLALDAAAVLGQDTSTLRAVVLAAGDPPGGLVALDADGAVLRALVGSHADSAADAGWLLSQVEGGRDTWLAATEVEPTAGSTVALLSWLHRSDEAAWSAARRFTLPTGWLLERLGGDAAVGSHDAVGTAVLDLRDPRRWRTELLDVVDGERDWEASLPSVASTAEPVGMLATPAAEELGVAPGLPLHLGAAPATGDAG